VTASLELTKVDPSHFWSKVHLGDGCWEWTARRYPRGYGAYDLPRPLKMQRRPVPAHRVAYALFYGVEPGGLWVLHRCDNPPCVRPDHLFLGTHADNMADMYAKKRDKNSKKTHCPQGHPYAGDNLYVTPAGGRICRACKRLRSGSPSWTPAKCGTNSGRQAHLSRGEIPCDACRLAHNAYQRARRQRMKEQNYAAA
jgi:hypothetical protein